MKIQFTISLVLCFTSFLMAQDSSISGVMLDGISGEALPFANIYNKTQSVGSVTDLDGTFTISANLNDLLEFSYVGYETQEVTVTSLDQLSISLSQGATALDEIVVIGFSTATKKELTGAVSVVKAEEIEALNPTRLEQALQGQSAGVQISSQSGSPGGDFNIRIRGISSNGDNNPLILVDGVRYEDLGALDPSNIESINVLKDASAAIYGVQAANGVILITTKKGRANMKPTVDIHTYYGIQETARKIPVLNALEYALLTNEAHVNGGSTAPFSDISSLGTGTDWQDEVFETAPVRNVNLSVKGGGDRSIYSVGGSYFKQNGIVGDDKSSFRRVTANINHTVNILDNLKFNTIVQYTNLKRKTLNENNIGSVLFNALNMPPTLSTLQSDGSYTLAEGLGAEVINPLAQIANTFNNTDVNRFTGKAAISYEPIEGLTLETSFPFNYSDVQDNTFSPEVFFGSGKVFNAVESKVEESTKSYTSWGWDNVANYEKVLNDVHKFNFTLGMSLYEEKSHELFGTGFGIPNNSVEFATIFQAQEIRDGGSNSTDGIFRLTSQFGRIQYGYNYKYLASFILRRDGTTRFGPNNRFGYFPSAALSWVLSEEQFFQSDFIDFAKLRVSYGITGNDKIGDFRYVASLDGEAEYVYNGDTFTSGRAIGAIANPDITWERNKQFNIGLDLNLAGEKISFTADYFYKKSDDLLLEIPVSGLTGYNAPGGRQPIANAGSIKNTGVELAIGYRDDFSDRVALSFGVNGTYLKNTTVSLNDGVAFIPGGGFGIGQLPPTRWEVGQPIGYFYGLQSNGIFQNHAEITAHGAQEDAQPGDIRFVDLNNDGTINQEDRTFIGTPIPEFILGVSFNLDFYGFDFSFLADSEINRDIVRNYERNLPLTNRTSFTIDRWHGEGTSTDFPRLTTGATTNTLFSDFYVEDGTYLRIKNVQLGYNFPQSNQQKNRHVTIEDLCLGKQPCHLHRLSRVRTQCIFRRAA